MNPKVPLLTIFMISLLSIGALAFEYLPWWDINGSSKSIGFTLETSSQNLDSYAEAITMASRQGDSKTLMLAVARLNDESQKYQKLAQTRTSVLLGLLKLILNTIFLFGLWLVWNKYSKPPN